MIKDYAKVYHLYYLLLIHSQISLNTDIKITTNTMHTTCYLSSSIEVNSNPESLKN